MKSLTFRAKSKFFVAPRPRTSSTPPFSLRSKVVISLATLAFPSVRLAALVQSMKIITGRGQFSLPSATKSNSTHFSPIDKFSHTFLSDLARVVSAKTGVNIASNSSPGVITLAYFPRSGDPSFEVRFREVNSVLSKDSSNLIILFSDLGGIEDSGVSAPTTNLTPPYKRSANQSIVDQFRGLGLKDPSRVLFFTWETSPTQEQISALSSLASIKVKTLLASSENSTVIESIRKHPN